MNLINKNTTNIILIIISIILGLFFIFFGLDYTDTPFHALSYQGNIKLSWMTFGSSLIGKFWIKIFGDQIIILRLLHVICNFTAILLSVDCIEKDKRFESYGLVFLLSTLFWICISFNILSYDSFTILAISFCFWSTCRFCTESTVRNSVLLGLSLLFAISVRFPNITIMVPVVLLCSRYGVGLIKLSVISIVSLITWLLLFFILRDRFMIFLTDDSHSILPLVKGQLHSLLRLLTFGIFIGLVFKYLGQYKRFFVLVFISIIIYVKSAYFFNNFAGNNRGNSSSLLILFIIPCLMYYWKFQLARNLCINSMFVLFFALVAIQGSNTGVLKLSHGFIFFIPILVNTYLVNKDKFALFFTAIIIFCFLNKLVLSPTYEDENIATIISHPRNTVSNEKLKYILSGRNSTIEKDISDRNKIKKNAILWGVNSNLYYYLLDHEKVDPFFINNSSTSNANWLFKYLEKSNTSQVVLTDTFNRFFLEKNLRSMNFSKTTEISLGSVYTR